MKQYQLSLQIIFLTSIVICNAASAASAPHKSPASLSAEEIAYIEQQAQYEDRSSLITAIRNNNLPAVRYFIQKSPQDVTRPSKNLYPLFHAAHVGSVPIAQALVASKANVNQANTDAINETPLMRAAYLHDVPMAQYLIGIKADTNAKTSENYSVLDYVYVNRERLENIQIIDILKAAGAEHKQPIPSIQNAILRQWHSVLSILIHSGHDINAPITDDNNIKYTPFEYSLRSKSFNATAAKMLIDAGADLQKTYGFFHGSSLIQHVMSLAIKKNWFSENESEQEYLSILQKVLDSKRVDLDEMALITAVTRYYAPGTRMLLAAGATYLPEIERETVFVNMVRECIANDQQRKQIAVQFLCKQTESEHNAKNIGNIIGEYLGVSKT